MCKERLDKNARFKVIQFNAWRYGGENIKRALLRETYLQLSKDRTAAEKALAIALKSDITSTIPTRVSWKDSISDLQPAISRGGALLIIALGIFVIVAVAWAILVAIRNDSHITLESFWGAFSGVVTGVSNITVLALGAIVIGAFTQLRFLNTPYRTTAEKRSPWSVEEAIEAVLQTQLSAYLQQHDQRIIVFVDDLDRLSADEMVNGLDAVRNFMDMDVGPMAHHGRPDVHRGIVFVISCDEDRIAEALSKRRSGTSEVPATILRAQDARRFLDRVFQYRLEIPPFPRQDMRAFVRGKLDIELKELRDSIQAHGASPDDVIDRLIQHDVSNPRAAIQLLNAFGQSWWLAIKREEIGATLPNRIGALRTGTVTSQASVLAVLCALRVLHPSFYQQLLAAPDLLSDFLVIFGNEEIRAHQRLEQLSDRRRRAIEPFLKEQPAHDEASSPLDSESSEDHGDEVDEKKSRAQLVSPIVPRPVLKPEHQGVMDALSWRRHGLMLTGNLDIEPLLLLSQDHLRRTSDRSVRELYQSALSPRRLLTELGVRNDRPFQLDEVRRLRAMIEDELDEDTRTNQLGPYQTLTSTDVLERLPQDLAHLVANPLAQGLLVPRLRHYVGIEQTLAVASRSTGHSQRDLLDVIARAVLLYKTDTPFLDANEAGLLSDRELRHGVNILIPLLVETGAAHEIFEPWLTRLNLGQSGEQVRLETFMSWFERFPQLLNAPMGYTYARHVMAALRNGTLELDDPAEVIGRLGGVWLSSRSTEGAPDLKVAEGLSALLQQTNSKLVEAALAFWINHVELFTAVENSSIAMGLAEHLYNNAESTTPQERALRQTYVDFVLSRPSDEVDEPALGRVLTQWSKHEESVDAFHALATPGLRVFPTQVNAEIEDWAEELEALSDAALTWLGSHLSSIADPSRTKVVGQIEQELSVLPPKHPKVLEILTNNGMASHACAPMFRSITVDLLSQLQTTQGTFGYSNYRSAPLTDAGVLDPLLPILRALLATAPIEAGKFLNTLVTYLAANDGPRLIAALEEFEDNWPEEMDGTDVEIIVQKSAPVVQGQGRARPRAVDSLMTLINRNPGEQPHNLHEDMLKLALSLWAQAPELSIRLFDWAQVPAQPTEVVQLASDRDLGAAAEVGLLAKAWGLFAPRTNAADKVSVARGIINTRSKHGKHTAELLSMWLNASSLDSADREIFIILSQTTLPEEDFDMLWEVASRQLGNLDLYFIITQMIESLIRGEHLNILSDVFEKLYGIMDSELKRDTAKQIKVRAFIAGRPAVVIRQATKWIHVLDKSQLSGSSIRSLDIDLKNTIKSIIEDLKKSER